MTQGTVTPSHLNCPRCGLTLAHPACWEPEYCPRCIARRHVAVRLFASTLPADELYASGAAPGREGTGGRRSPGRPGHGR